MHVVQAPQPDIYMYGFGSPRVGNIPFAEKFDELVFNAWRISNLNDIVTK
jgi:predicted lipase